MYYNAEDDLWFDFSVPGAQLAPGWHWEWTVHYPVSRVDYVTIPPIIDPEVLRHVRTHMGLEFD